MGVKSKANTTKTMKTRTETNLWSNVYWNQKKSEDNNDSSKSSCSSSNSYNSPFNNPNITDGAFGSLLVCSTNYYLHDLSLNRRKSDWFLSIRLILNIYFNMIFYKYYAVIPRGTKS